ncbi:hypothetical protein GSI_05160 [Ganoderma sinense ZZ0214-1]|uniref:Uncharacterized protein n=1 Tax=Ganoderma sinense ZZ0214-1 TaxID=1077348 RepID=A0A2G8SFU6_9APHY|nr:hypothetical protein GSI_05160 [Ganoderma sinense ZZ0214-1]
MDVPWELLALGEFGSKILSPAGYKRSPFPALRIHQITNTLPPLHSRLHQTSIQLNVYIIMDANTITLVRSEFTLAGPVSTTTVHPASQSLARRIELNARVHRAHVRAHIRRLQSLGRGLPSSTRGPQRRTRAVAHTTASPARRTTTTPHFPAARRPLAAIILNGLSTARATPAPIPQAEVAERPLLVTRRSDVFEDDSEDPLFTPRVPEDGARRTPGAPANTNGSGDYFPAPPPAPADIEDGEI